MSEINVRDFIFENLSPYNGDSSFLVVQLNRLKNYGQRLKNY